MKRFLMISLLIITVVTLCGCSNKNSIVGRWIGHIDGETVRIEFFKDGAFNLWGVDNDKQSGSWLIDNELLIMIVNGETEALRFSVSGDKMVISSSEYTETIIFTRVR